MSASALTIVGGVYVYDFTNAKAKAFDSQQRNLGGGYFGMYCGDINNDGEVFSADLGLFVAAYPAFNVYHNADLNMDGEVFSGDISFLLVNYPTFTSIP
jgi:hypothetical protein